MDVKKDVEVWAASREQEQHKEALQMFGERVIVRNVWKTRDYEEGLVDLCPDCHAGGSDQSVKNRMAAVYGGSGDTQCPSCYGVGYEGGFQPTIYVMHAFVETDPDELYRGRSGQMWRETPHAQFLWEPKVWYGDLLVRARSWLDDTTIDVEDQRFVLQNVSEQEISTGPINKQTGRSRVVVAQMAQINNLPRDHHYQRVPIA